MRKIRSHLFVSSGVRARHVQPHLTGWLLHGDIFFRGPWSSWWWRCHTWGTAVLVGCRIRNKSSWESTVAFPNSFSKKKTMHSLLVDCRFQCSFHTSFRITTSWAGGCNITCNWLGPTWELLNCFGQYTPTSWFDVQDKFLEKGDFCRFGAARSFA